MLRARKSQLGMGPRRSTSTKSAAHWYTTRDPKTRSDAIKLFIMIFVAVLFFGVFYLNVNGMTVLSDDANVLNIAVVILLTKDPGISGGFLDSITAFSVSLAETESRHSIKKIALVHEDVTECLPILRLFGFKIISRSIPIKMDEIENRGFAEKLENDGCCGPLELLKLEVWTLNQYDYILSMDADMHFHRNFDHIFDVISMDNITNAKTKNNGEYNGKYLAWTHGASADFSNGKFRGEVINGGFLLVRPNIDHYEQMLALVKEGDFREDGSAWKGSHIGWVYGGKTIQGIVPYFYFGVLGKGVADIELDRCIFNVEFVCHRIWRIFRCVLDHYGLPLMNRIWWKSTSAERINMTLLFRIISRGVRSRGTAFIKSISRFA